MNEKRRRDPWWLFKYVVVSALDGVAFGWMLLLIVLWRDIGGLGSLVHGSNDGAVALYALLIAFGTAFAFVGIAWRVMVLLPEQE